MISPRAHAPPRMSYDIRDDEAELDDLRLQYLYEEYVRTSAA